MNARSFPEVLALESQPDADSLPNESRLALTDAEPLPDRLGLAHADKCVIPQRQRVTH